MPSPKTKMKKKNEDLEGKLGGLHTPRGDQRRAQILNAVIDLIASGEATDLSFERIAKACKIRRSLVAYYFETPELLLKSTIEYALSFGQEYAVNKITLASTAEDRLRAFVDGNFEWFRDYPKHAAVFGFVNYLASSHPVYRKLHSGLAEMAEKRLEAILLGGKLIKGRKAQVPAVASILRAHLVGMLARHFTADKAPAWDKNRELTHSTFAKLCELVWEK